MTINTEAIMEDVVTALREKDWERQYVVMESDGRVLTMANNAADMVYSPLTWIERNENDGSLADNTKWWWLESGRTTTRDIAFDGIQAGRIAVVQEKATEVQRLVFQIPLNCYFYELRTSADKAVVYELDEAIHWLSENEFAVVLSNDDTSRDFGSVIAQSLLRGHGIALRKPRTSHFDATVHRMTRFKLNPYEAQLIPIRGERRHYMEYPYADIEALQRLSPRKEENDGAQTTTTGEERDEEP